ncbi:MAG: GNAT family N-acetyltransferase [Firmicutes bacterium]|nr:GNAT family N-acetyltransferase [Bacillota bacterium]
MNGKIAKSFPDREFTISDFCMEDLESFIQIHFESLFRDSAFSKIYLTERFKYLINFEDAITVSVKNDSDKMIGLVYGGPEGYKKQMNKYIMKKILLGLLRKPNMLFSAEFLYKYKHAINKLSSRFMVVESSAGLALKEKTHVENMPLEPIARLTGIAVLKEYSNLGVGRHLLVDYEKAAVQKGYKSIVLETPAANIDAIMFYEKLGWISYTNKDAAPDKHCFYKLISKEI